MQYMFLEYFISIANIPQALRWAKRLEPKLDRPSLSLSNLRIVGEGKNGDRSLLSAGHIAAFCWAFINKLWRPKV